MAPASRTRIALTRTWRLRAGALALLAGCAATPPPGPAFEARVPASRGATAGAAAAQGPALTRYAVAAANPLASAAGAEMLAAGGSAVDAAIAVQMVLTLVEPQSSGIGGGAFLLHWDGQRIDAYDGRETAPAAVDARLFLQPDGKPMPFDEAVVGGRSVGVPGALRMLETAHRRHGRLPWHRLFAPAIALAEQGFVVSARLHAQLAAEQALRRQPDAAAFYYGDAGKPWPVGHRLRNPALAAVLREVAAQGSDAFYRGPIAADLVRRVQRHAGNPGRMTEVDLARYEARVREPICTDWKAIYRVCGFPPPSSGHLALMQILKLIEHAPAVAQPLVDGLPAPDWLHVYTEAARLAFADRARYVADPDFVAAPAGDWRSLLGDAYLRERARLIGVQSMKTARPGVPGSASAQFAPQPEQPESGTSHISIVDARGQAIAMTTTIEAVWGSRILADGGTGLPGGYLLNNQLTDFAFAPADPDGREVANRVQPGKRARSSMSPTLVFDRRDGRLLMSAGSPGGAGIVHYVAKALIGTLDWGLSAQEAVGLPNFGSFNGPTLLERQRFPASTIMALEARGHAVNAADLTSGLQVLQRVPQGWRGGADPRREGLVLGE